MVTQLVNAGTGIHPWELECQVRTLNWWIILFPCDSHSGYLCILRKYPFFLSLGTSSESFWGITATTAHHHHLNPSDLGETDIP